MPFSSATILHFIHESEINWHFHLSSNQIQNSELLALVLKRTTEPDARTKRKEASFMSSCGWMVIVLFRSKQNSHSSKSKGLVILPYILSYRTCKLIGVRVTSEHKSVGLA